uniref:RING-type domain-containing protein n=1 Tax=Panagrolaimus sp. JU765 TaxID=591449 RepID=A0AC34QX10_9BILA
MLGDCTICLDSLSDNVASLQCGHIYHFDCAKSWILQSGTCPVCRKKQRRRDLIKLVIDDEGTDWPQKLQEAKVDLKQVKSQLRKTKKELSTANENLSEVEKRCELLEESNKTLAKKLKDAKFRLRQVASDSDSVLETVLPQIQVDSLFHSCRSPKNSRKRKTVATSPESQSPRPKRRHFEN